MQVDNDNVTQLFSLVYTLMWSHYAHSHPNILYRPR